MGLFENILIGICTLAIWSLIYRENIFYRYAEHFYTGFAASLIAVQGWESVKKIAFIPLMQGQLIWILVPILSIPFFLFFFRKTRSTYMIPIALLVGLGTALGLRGAIHAQILGQVVGTMGSIIKETPMATFNATLVAIGTFCTLSYFTFTREIKGPLKTIPRVGRLFIMAGLGGAFANTTMGRLANMSGILLKLWKTEAIYIIAGAAIIIAIDIIRSRTK